ncbi:MULTISPECIES: site-specific integrase [Methylomonas]|uniref:Integrase SAM-like N-terminal domain-containing protein n=1 Tax=Methylomonas koyamae TaxID=702114 RepID=A0AA91I573_9GAMM|nr:MULTISPECIES: site-specific integrase [Methylomonas]ANE57902.1 hypothetical protein AYM39_21640 [Methylomonas sp. DH-1]OAI24165.1 hypothetical protein A1356_15890 [Methylomonas koyamae]BBL60919.1 hypothetical protein MKFW12EY_45320 [Methylomonas koyamae]
MTDTSKIQQLVPIANRILTAENFRRLSDVPPEVEWYANLTYPQTRRVYQNAVEDFMRFAGIQRPEEFRDVTRAHVIAWGDDLGDRVLNGTTIRHRLSAFTFATETPLPIIQSKA